MTIEEITAIDPSNMYELIRKFPDQVEEAIHIGNAAKIRLNSRSVQNIVLNGMGGSAIGGDLLKSYLAGEIKVPFTVNRNYTLPRFVGQEFSRYHFQLLGQYRGNHDCIQGVDQTGCERFFASLQAVKSRRSHGKEDFR